MLFSGRVTILAQVKASLQISADGEATSKDITTKGRAEVDMLSNLNFSAFQSQEFIVGIAVAAILVSALIASSMFRNIALALAAGAIVLLYLQGGVPALLATSQVVEKEIRAMPEFSNGLVVGFAVAAVFLFGMQKRST
jgi:uncharacterized membrane protein